MLPECPEQVEESIIMKRGYNEIDEIRTLRMIPEPNHKTTNKVKKLRKKDSNRGGKDTKTHRNKI